MSAKSEMTSSACPICAQAAERVDGVCLGCAARLVDATHSFSASSALLGPPPSLPGWEVQRSLAIGGMGQLWLVHEQDHPNKEAVAKLASPTGGTAAETRLETEAEILSRLQHPHIVSLIDVATAEDGRLAIILEYVKGCDLRRLLRAEKLSMERSMDIFFKLCAALGHAHGQGIVHRDVKPSNILVDAAGAVKLADFGLARQGESVAGYTQHTSAGDGLGTPYYLAPEMMRGASTADARADVYALGVLLYEMLSGSVPLGTYEPLSKLCGLERGWDAFMREALMQDPAQRIASVEEMEKRATGLWNREQSRGNWRHRRKALGVAAAVVLSGTSGAFFAGRERSPEGPTYAKPEAATFATPWTNSLGMKFLPLRGYPILMGVHEVRRAEFAIFQEYERALLPSYRKGAYPRRQLGVLTKEGWVLREDPRTNDPGFPVTPEHPVGGVFPNDAQSFCSWLSLREQAEGRLLPAQHYRLPTTEEWTAAAGDFASSPGNWSGPETLGLDWPIDRPIHVIADAFLYSSPVGSFPPNALGFCDCGGNVSELAVSADSRPIKDTGFLTNLVSLGGSWAETPAPDNLGQPGKLRTNRRQRVDTGFRCVLDLGVEK